MGGTYLGGGLSADFNGHQVELYTGNGYGITNQVFLDQSVLNAFLQWVNDKKAAI